MAQSIIELGFDPAALEPSKKAVMDQLMEVYNMAQKINDTQIRLGTDNSWQVLATSQKELANTIKAIDKANRDLVTSMQKANAAAKEDVNVTKQSTQANNDNTASIKKKNTAAKETPEQRQAYVNSIPFTSNLADLKAEAEQAEQTGTAVNELDIAQAEAANSATVWGEASAITAAEEGKLQVATMTAAMSLKEKIALEKEAALAAKEEIAINEYLSNDYKQLSQAYQEATLKAKNYALAIGETHPATLEAIADANMMGETLKRLDASVGQNQRNVGNYAGSLEGAFAKVTNASYLIVTAISQATRMLIRFGVQMLLFQVIGKAVEAVGAVLAEKYKEMIAPVSELIMEQDLLNRALSDSNNVYGKAIENVDKLTVDVGLAKQGFVDKSEVVKEYNDTMGKTTGLVNNLDEVEQKLVDDGPAYIKMMFDKAVATLALGDAAKAAVEAEKLRQEALVESQRLDKLSAVSVFQPGAFTGGVQPTKDTTAQTNVFQGSIDAQQTASDQSLDIFKKYETDIATIAKQYGFDMFGDDGTGVEKAHKLIDAEGQLHELFLKKMIDFNQSVYANDKNSYDIRLNALNKEGGYKIELLKTQAESELKVNAETQDNITAELKTAKAKQRSNLLIDLENAEGQARVIRQKYANEELKQSRDNATAKAKFEEDAFKATLTAEEAGERAKLEETGKVNLEISGLENQSVDDRTSAYVKYYEAQQQLLVNDYNFQVSTKKLTDAELLALQEENNAKRLDLLRKAQKDISAIIVSSGKQEEDDLQTSNALTLSQQKLALFNSLKDKIGGIESYNKQVKEIDKKAKIQSLEDDVDFYKMELLDQKIQGDDRIKLQEELKKKETELNNAKIDAGTDNDPKKKLDYEVNISIEAQDKIVTAIDARYEREKQLIDEKIAAVQRGAEIEINAVNSSTESQLQKAAAIAQIQRTAAQEEAALRKESAKEAADKAKFDKAVAIAKVIENTAMGATAAAADPLTLWEVPFILGLGAVELAAAAGTKIPAYAKGAGVNGRPLHGGGPALFGEAGMELIEQPGMAAFTAYRPTIMDLAPNTKITPIGSEANNYLLNKTIAALEIPTKVDERWLAGAIVSGITDELQNVTRAIKKQKNGGVNIHLDSKFGNYINTAIRE